MKTLETVVMDRLQSIVMEEAQQYPPMTFPLSDGVRMVRHDVGFGTTLLLVMIDLDTLCAATLTFTRDEFVVKFGTHAAERSHPKNQLRGPVTGVLLPMLASGWRARVSMAFDEWSATGKAAAQ